MIRDDKMIGLLDVSVQSCDALDVGIDETFKDQSFGLFLGSQSLWVDIDRTRRNHYFDIPFIDDGGTNVPSLPVLSSDILGDLFVSAYEGVSLLVVTAVKDLTLKIRAVSSELGECLTWLSACIAAISASTATLTCLVSTRWTTTSS
jgi:hypothetical protein